MNQNELLSAIVDSIPYPVVFVDAGHVIRYLNARGMKKYSHLLGRSIFDCHNPRSCQKILDIFARFEQGGGEEFMYLNDENYRAYMTPVRDAEGTLLGYFERYEKNEQIER